MFSGIVKERGTIKRIKKSTHGTEIIITAPRTSCRARVGNSVAVNGVCLTVAGKTPRVLKFMLMPETVNCTTFVHSCVGEKVGLEPSIRVGDEMGGHFVYGHVDGRGKVVKLMQIFGALIMTVRASNALLKYMIKKGSVAVDGVSLTIMRLAANSFTVSLLQQTLDLTSLGSKQQGDEVNIEVDMINKFLLERVFARQNARRVRT